MGGVGGGGEEQQEVRDNILIQLFQVQVFQDPLFLTILWSVTMLPYAESL